MTKRIPTRRNPSMGVVRRGQRSGASMMPKPPVVKKPAVMPPNFK